MLPELKDIQTVSRAIAFAVGKVAGEQGVAVKPPAEALLQAISDNFTVAGISQLSPHLDLITVTGSK
ncbi:hypothetical protein MJ390_16175 [Klebsiella pneumoniae]|nr:hypothetical protein MJ390_16175 [Klebsiella pneumoniae]